MDLGAGTGILSRVVRALGHEVVAVEPDDRMRARLQEASPDVTALAGTAEEIPLPDECVDAVVAGQAYHWFDHMRAHPEIARVLRPGGVLAALWNDADLTVPWTVRLVAIIDNRDATEPGQAVDFGQWFGEVDRAEFRHEERMTPDNLVAMATTRSPYLVASADGREAIVTRIRELLAGPELAGRETFAMPHITRVRRAYAV